MTFGNKFRRGALRSCAGDKLEKRRRKRKEKVAKVSQLRVAYGRGSAVFFWSRG